MSWLEASVRFPIRVTQIAPEPYLASAAMLNAYNAQALGRADTSSDFDSVLDDHIDVIYTDCWPKADEHTAKEEIRELFLPYQVTGNHLSGLKAGAMFLPCPPVTRGEEVSEAAMRSPLCLNHQAKTYLLHSQNAIMEMLAAGI
jgi:ornithine carbamoyltransferase